MSEIAMENSLTLEGCMSARMSSRCCRAISKRCCALVERRRAHRQAAKPPIASSAAPTNKAATCQRGKMPLGPRMSRMSSAEAALALELASGLVLGLGLELVLAAVDVNALVAGVGAVGVDAVAAMTGAVDVVGAVDADADAAVAVTIGGAIDNAATNAIAAAANAWGARWFMRRLIRAGARAS